jgi:hypothetical protein
MSRATFVDNPSGLIVWLFLSGLALLLASPAWASLGDSVTSVESDKAHMKGTLRSITTNQYIKHEIQMPTGQIVREFVSPEGKVFGIAWEGPFQPDFQQILGSYFGTMKGAVAAQQRHGRGAISIETPGFVFQQGGHMRKFHGRAYLPTLLPPSVDPAEVH